MPKRFIFSWRRASFGQVPLIAARKLLPCSDMTSIPPELVNGESTLVVIPFGSGEPGAGLSELEKAPDELAEMLALGRDLPRQYALGSQSRSYRS